MAKWSGVAERNASCLLVHEPAIFGCCLQPSINIYSLQHNSVLLLDKFHSIPLAMCIVCKTISYPRLIIYYAYMMVVTVAFK